MAIELYSDSDVMSFKCGAAVTAARAVKLDTTADSVVHSAAEGDGTIGVALTTGATGDWISVQMGGKAKMTASAAITINTQVEAAAAGKIATAGGAASHSLGWALETAAADGEIITVLLATPVVKGPANA